MALFGAVGWSVLCFAFPEALDRTSYDIMQQFMAVQYWIAWFLIFATLQLIGLMQPKLHPARLAGSLGIFFGFLIMVYAIVSSEPVPLGLCMYLACAAIEGFAVVFHTSQVVRSYKGLPQWIIRR